MKYKLTNWVDGMGVIPQHFIQSENHLIELVSTSCTIGMGNHSYGILPSSADNKDLSEIDIQEKITGSVEVRLCRCNAITKGGYHISFNPDTENFLIKNLSLASITNTNYSVWEVILSVNPYKRVPTGPPDLEEDPPRHPYVIPELELFILPANEFNLKEAHGQHLIVGRIKLNGGKYEIDGNYIPPCTCMASHPRLSAYHSRFLSLINELEKASNNIIFKIQDKKINSTLSGDIEMLCQGIMTYISDKYFSIFNLGLEWEPIRIVEFFSSLAHMYYVKMSFIAVKDREELFNYFHEWEELIPGTFESIITKAIEIQYDHNNLVDSMMKVDEFISTLTKLWTKLSNLEYIGQHKESMIVSETPLKSSNTKSERWKLFKK